MRVFVATQRMLYSSGHFLFVGFFSQSAVDLWRELPFAFAYRELASELAGGIIMMSPILTASPGAWWPGESPGFPGGPGRRFAKCLDTALLCLAGRSCI